MVGTWTCQRWLTRLAALCALALLGCATPLRVGTSNDYAPFSLAGEGFDVEVAKRFGAELGRPVKFVPFKWPDLAERAAHGDFDVAMSGISWRPDRDVHGWLSLSVGTGGPCWVGSPAPRVLAVNRGGVLEAFARAQFPKARIVTVDDNLALPGLLAKHEVDAFVTDTFELRHMLRPGNTSACRDGLYRKVYWVTQEKAAELGPRLDEFLRAHEAELDSLRTHWFGAPQPRSETDHLLDLVTRRLELMTAVGAWKRAHRVPIEDRAQEKRVLQKVAARAQELGLEPKSVSALFKVQIELAKRLEQKAATKDAALDLESELRPAIARLSERQLDSLARVAPLRSRALDKADLAALGRILQPHEVARLREALVAVKRAR
jgi:chorismate mutase-like protein